MIKVSVRSLINSIPVMQKLATTEFRGKVAFQIGRILKRVEEEANLYDNARKALIYKYGETDENGELIVNENGSCTIKQEFIEDYNREVNELLDTEIEINAELINYNDLDGGNFTPQEVMMIESFIQ